MFAQDVEHALKVHNYIATLEQLTETSLKNSPIILESPSQTIIFETPNYQKSYYEYVEPLYEDIGDHDLLFKAMRTGWSYIDSHHTKVPKKQEKYCQQWNHSQALRVAKERGYLVADEFLREQKVAYGEYEAYYAVREMLHGNASGVWLKNSNFNEFMQSYAKWHKSVKLITSQFIVPSKDTTNPIPYILDQLWLVAQDDNQVRLLGLEIDGEHHIFNKLHSKTLGRDNYLKELGYEIYRAASWWCRVDPYRVICEFLHISGIFPNAIHYLIGSNLKSVDEYKCGICHAPMVRCSWDWIQQYHTGHSTVLAHKSCVLHKKNRFMAASGHKR